MGKNVTQDVWQRVAPSTAVRLVHSSASSFAECSHPNLSSLSTLLLLLLLTSRRFFQPHFVLLSTSHSPLPSPLLPVTVFSVPLPVAIVVRKTLYYSVIISHTVHYFV